MVLNRKKRILFTGGVAKAIYRCDTCDIETTRTVTVVTSYNLRQIRASRLTWVVAVVLKFSRTVGGDPGEQFFIPAVPRNQYGNRYWSDRPHLTHSTRSTPRLPIRSTKMIAPSRGIWAVMD